MEETGSSWWGDFEPAARGSCSREESWRLGFSFPLWIEEMISLGVKELLMGMTGTSCVSKGVSRKFN